MAAERYGEARADTGHVLIVDDYPMNRMKLARILADQGHSSDMAENGRQALEMIQAHPFDVVLLDILMPDMDGYEVLRRIKDDANIRDIPVIVISAVDEVDSVVKCIEMGAEDYLPKPFNPTLLQARLRTSLQRKRLRDLERSYLQQEVMLRQSEKLATLGRLSAGMAHELNNPAAAAQRGAGQLRAAVKCLQDAQRRLGERNLSGPQMEAVERLDRLARERAAQPVMLDSLASNDRESELERWLTEQGLENGWELAPALANMDLDGAGLAALVDGFSPEQRPALIAWLCDSYAVYSLLEDVGRATTRIARLVDALKMYSYMDQAPVQEVDIHQGLENTLVILGERLGAGVAVRREYDQGLPRIQAYGSQLNQVWTNIIDNAVDAMGGQGELVLRTRREGEWAVVEIEDSGPGIPAEVRPRLFDPFFTTKPPGKGAGLGLNISHNVVVGKHGGQISADSLPGRTRFVVKLPVRMQAPAAA
jgi:signal transduction histidine kinase